MIDHLSFYATDYAKTRAFYEAAFAALGYANQGDMVTDWDTEWPTRRMCSYGPGNKRCFWVIESKETSTPRHVAFAAADRKAVDAFYAAALGAGGKDNGAPGPRPVYHANYYGAFVLDPDGNNVEAVCHKGV